MPRADIDYSKRYTISCPAKESEFEIQSMIYGILKHKDGFIVKGEVKAYKSRLDIVVYDKSKNPKCIIEVKARGKIRKVYRKYKQVEKYEKLFNLPVVVCHNRAKVGETLTEVRKIMGS